MQRVIDEMAKAKGDVEKRYREKIPEIIRECMAFAYLGKTFTFDASPELNDRVNKRLIELSDEILSDIEARARKAIKYAEEEDDEDIILAYMKREQNGEDLITRIDKHNSNFRYFLEGWIAIGLVNNLATYDLTNQIMTYMHNVYVSELWQMAFREGYLSNAIRTQGYHFGKGIMKNPITALTELERHSINTAFQYGRFKRFQKDGAIGYTIHRNSGFDCPYCDSFTGVVHPLTESLLPLHPRCICFSRPVYGNYLENVTKESKNIVRNGALTEAQKQYRKSLQNLAIEKYKGKVVRNVFDIQISAKSIKEFLNQPHRQYFEKNELVRDLPKVIENATYKGVSKYHKDNKYIKASHIYETYIDGEKSYLIIRETKDGEYFFHSISDGMEIK